MAVTIVRVNSKMQCIQTRRLYVQSKQYTKTTINGGRGHKSKQHMMMKEKQKTTMIIQYHHKYLIDK
jgi:hypothetical protein